ncbi:MAG: hypothetical protein GDA49_04395 [Rhodospirillales bacterium]|nr:hypothetical protein [Rhodospirillales bacterium]
MGHELGWIGDFYLHLVDDRYLDHIFEENIVTNYGSLFNTDLIDMLVYGKDGTRKLSEMPLELLVAG